MGKLISFDIDNERKKNKKSKKNKHKFIKKRDRELNNQQPYKKRKMNVTEVQELERLKDQRERSEFEARMRRKDLQRKQKLSQEQQQRLDEELKRKALQFGDKKQMERARVISSRQYKQKRAEQQLFLYSKQIQDEEENFGDHLHELTQKEIEKQKEEFNGYYTIPSQYDRTDEGMLDKKAREN